MRKRAVFVLIPLGGYAGLWILGSVFFLLYFEAFNIPMNLGYNAMMQRVPALLAVPTVPLCCFASFFATTRFVLKKLAAPIGTSELLGIAVVSVLAAVGLDLVITVGIEGLDILVFPVDVMYLLAYIVVVPTVVWAGHWTQVRNSVKSVA